MYCRPRRYSGVGWIYHNGCHVESRTKTIHRKCAIALFFVHKYQFEPKRLTESAIGGRFCLGSPQSASLNPVEMEMSVKLLLQRMSVPWHRRNGISYERNPSEVLDHFVFCDESDCSLEHKYQFERKALVVSESAVGFVRALRNVELWIVGPRLDRTETRFPIGIVGPSKNEDIDKVTLFPTSILACDAPNSERSVGGGGLDTKHERKFSLAMTEHRCRHLAGKLS